MKNQLLNLELWFAEDPRDVLEDYVGTVGIERVQVRARVLSSAH